MVWKWHKFSILYLKEKKTLTLLKLGKLHSSVVTDIQYGMIKNVIVFTVAY